MKKYDVWNRTIKPKLTTFTCSSKRHRCSYTPQNCWTEQTEQHLCPPYILTTSGVKKHKGSAGVSHPFGGISAFRRFNENCGEFKCRSEECWSDGRHVCCGILEMTDQTPTTARFSIQGKVCC